MTEQHYQVRTLEGCFFCDKRDKIVGAVIESDRVWEFFETEWVKSIVKEGDYVVDAGANIGWYTVVMARLVGPTGRVFAFEPEPENFKLLKKNVEWNGFSDRCTLFQHALWEESKKLPLVLHSFNLGDHALKPSGAHAPWKVDAVEVMVACETLDSVLFEQNAPHQGSPLLPADARIRLLKVDTQGSEVSILKGAQKALAATQYLLTEFSPINLKLLGTDGDALVAVLKETFHEFTRIEKKKKIEFQPINDIEKDMLRPVEHWNGELSLALRKTSD